jgi:hypothetical protein
MFIKITMDIILDVKDKDEAEEACMALEGLDRVLRNNSFPHGDVIQADVDNYVKLTDDEIEEMGLGKSNR